MKNARRKSFRSTCVITVFSVKFDVKPDIFLALKTLNPYPFLLKWGISVTHRWKLELSSGGYTKVDANLLQVTWRIPLLVNGSTVRTVSDFYVYILRGPPI